MRYIYVCVCVCVGPPHMYSHMHINYALQTMCMEQTQTGSSKPQGREGHVLVSFKGHGEKRQGKGMMGKLNGGWCPVNRKKLMKAESYKVQGYTTATGCSLSHASYLTFIPCFNLTMTQ